MSIFQSSHLLPGRHLVCFHVLAIVNSAAMNTEVQVSFQMMVFSGYMIAGSCCCSVARSHPTLCDPMDCSTQDFPVHHQLPEPTQTHVYCIGDAIQPTILSSVILFYSCLQSFPASRSFPMSWLLTSGDQSIGHSALASERDLFFIR